MLLAPDAAPGVQRGQDDGDRGFGLSRVVHLGPADEDGRRRLGVDAVSESAHVPLRAGDLEVVAGVRLQVWDNSLPQTRVHLHLQPVVLNLRTKAKLTMTSATSAQRPGLLTTKTVRFSQSKNIPLLAGFHRNIRST